MKELNQLKNRENKNWINYLSNCCTSKYNVERVESLKEGSKNFVYNYVVRSLEILDTIKCDESVRKLVIQTLIWSEVSKGGTRDDAKKWNSLKFNLMVHNIGSSEIYVYDNPRYNEVVRVLIYTHGLIGQYLRGEVNLDKNKELSRLVERGLINNKMLLDVLIVLNKCVIGAVSIDLYYKLEVKINNAIYKVVNNDYDDKLNVVDRIKLLCPNFKIDELVILENEKLNSRLSLLFATVELWFFHSALKEFSLEEQVKILLISFNYIDGNTHHLSFEKVMKSMYIDYNEKKAVNIYRKRIIEKVLSNISINEIMNNNIKPNPHLKLIVRNKNNVLYFDFVFSKAASKLIDFCEVAYVSEHLYKKVVFLLYDIFGFRRDEYDRFYNEVEYLNTMNASINHKAKILEFMVGQNILDVGPGGGALMDLITDMCSELNVYGVDISKNVIDALNTKKREENKSWNVFEGDALNLKNTFKNKKMDTIIFSSIIHELYSYIKYEGKQFNYETIKIALKSAFDILNRQGRIIIRDGVLSDNKNDYRVIEFKDIEDINFLIRYCNDFKGRKITFEQLTKSKVKMLVNDAMEFLYTYTWGEDSYPLEVKEQFGYYTPKEYEELIYELFEGEAKIVYSHAFLQEGYEENLLNRITLYDDKMNVVDLPNSTYILVVEKN